MKVLVTGASGFIGRALIQKLSAKGYDVLGLYRRRPTHKVFATVIIGTLEDVADWQTSLQGVDIVFHLAGRAHKTQRDDNSAAGGHFRVNRDGTLLLASACLQAGVSRFVFMSSIGVNGNETFHEPFTESSPELPVGEYGRSKWEAEQQLTKLFAASESTLIRIRPPLVYGIPPVGNFSRLLRLLNLGLPMPFGAIVNRRSLISVDSLADFCIALTTHFTSANELYLLAEAHPLSTEEIIRALSIGLSRKNIQVSVPPQWLRWALSAIGKADLYTQLCGSLVIDATKAWSVPGWAPKHSTIDGLREVAERYAVQYLSKKGR